MAASGDQVKPWGLSLSGRAGIVVPRFEVAAHRIGFIASIAGKERGPMVEDVCLSGAHVRLEPLGRHHVDGLVRASADGGELYRWSPVPRTFEAAGAYVETALEWKAQGTGLAFAVISQERDEVIGSTRFFDLKRWAWPADHPRAQEGRFDTGEIGYTWLTPAAIRTAANSEAKLLLLTHAFETWRMHCVCFHADARNARSRAALSRLGAQFEGVLRSHRLAADHIARDSARFSITAAEWPQVRSECLARLQRAREKLL